MMTLDTFVDTPAMRMQLVGDSDGAAPIFTRMQHAVDAAEGRSIAIGAYEEFDFLRPPNDPLPSYAIRTPGPSRLLHPQERRDLNAILVEVPTEYACLSMIKHLRGVAWAPPGPQ